MAIIGDAASLWVWRGTSPRDNSLLRNADTAFAKRRFLEFDLRHPFPGSGATSLGVVRDSVARIHFFFREDSAARRIVGIRRVPVGSDLSTDRVEFWIRTGGHQYLLQFGPWGMGKYSPRGAVGGQGTVPASVVRADSSTWIVRSGPNAIGRLWNIDDIRSPSDAGLYFFNFSFRVEAVR